MKKSFKILFCVPLMISIFIQATSAIAENTRVYDTNSPPNKPIINGTIRGTIGVSYNYTFLTTDPDGDDVYYWIKWEPGCPSIEWLGPYPSGQEVTLTHLFNQRGTYSIQCQAKDIYNATSDPGLLSVTMPRSRYINRPFFNFIQDYFENHLKLLTLLGFGF